MAKKKTISKKTETIREAVSIACEPSADGKKITFILSAEKEITAHALVKTLVLLGQNYAQRLGVPYEGLFNGTERISDLQ